MTFPNHIKLSDLHLFMQYKTWNVNYQLPHGPGRKESCYENLPTLPHWTGMYAKLKNSYVKTDDRDRENQAKCQKSSQKVLEQLPGVVSQLGL